MMRIADILFAAGRQTRRQLADMAGMTDRAVRNKIADERQHGIPIVPMQGGGYKLAETDAEIIALENMYMSRVREEIRTVNALRNFRQSKGQISIGEYMQFVLFGGSSGKHTDGSPERERALLQGAIKDTVAEIKQEPVTDDYHAVLAELAAEP